MHTALDVYRRMASRYPLLRRVFARVKLLGDLPHPLSEKELFVEITLKAP